MRILTTALLALIVSVAVATGVQASMSIVFQQQEGVIITISSAGQLITSDYVEFSLANDQAFAKASQLQGEKVHILYYEAGDEKQCVDVRLAIEPAFEIAPPAGR